MFDGDLCQGGRRCIHKRQGGERSGVRVEDGAHVRVSLPKLVWKVMRVGVFREPGDDLGKDEDMAEYGMVGRHRLVEDSGS